MFYLKPFSWLLIIFGLGIFLMNRDIKSIGPLKYLPTMCFTVFYSVCTVSIFWKSDTQSETSAASNWIQFFPNILAYFTVITVTITQSEIMQTVLSVKESIDHIFINDLKLSLEASNQGFQKVSRIWTFVWTVAAILIGVFYFILGVKPHMTWTIFYWILFYVPKITLLLVNIEYIGCMEFIANRLHILNTEITWKLISSNSQNTSLFNRLDNLNLLKTLDLSTETQAEQNPSENRTLLTKTSMLIKNLQFIVSKMNQFFGLQILMSLLSAFVTITVQLHHIINELRYGFQSNDAYLKLITSVLLVILHSAEFWFIMSNGSKVKALWLELKTSIDVLKIEVNNQDDIKLQIQLLKISFINHPIEFTAFNIFSIGIHVIINTVSSVTTYLIILVQFQLTEDQNLSKGAFNSSNALFAHFPSNSRN